MTDVFICSIPKEKDIRYYLLQACFIRWDSDNECRLHYLTPGSEWLTNDNFQKERRVVAQKLASSDIYILTDDDCMPIGPDFIARGLAVMQSHPEFGILAAMNVMNKNDTMPYTGKFIDEDVWECHAVGGVRFCRKGIIKEWPELVDPGSYDCQHQEALEKAGYKAGYLRKVLMNHLGYGLSTHWPPGKPEIELYSENHA